MPAVEHFVEVEYADAVVAKSSVAVQVVAAGAVVVAAGAGAVEGTFASAYPT